MLAVDRDEQPVNDIAPAVTQALQLDASDVDALKAIGAGEFDHAIVAISSATEPSIFATMALKQLGVGNVVAKAGTPCTARSSSASGRIASSTPSERWASGWRTSLPTPT